MEPFGKNDWASDFEKTIFRKLVYRLIKNPAKRPMEFVWSNEEYGEEMFGGRKLSFTFKPFNHASMYPEMQGNEDPSIFDGGTWKIVFQMPMTWPMHLMIYGENPNHLPIRGSLIRLGNQLDYERDLMYIAMSL